jgi:hypothetical protein
VRTFDQWETIEHFLMSDPYKVISEFQHLIRNQVSDLQLLNMSFFEEYQSFQKSDENQPYLKNLPPTLKVIQDVLQATYSYISKRLSKRRVPSKKLENNNQDLDVVRDPSSQSVTQSVA